MTMQVSPIEVTLADLVEGYLDDGERGVRAYDDRLDVRPPYQREFVYDPPQRNAVICTASRGLPLNVMYWGRRTDGSFEVIDGQQRTISLCQYVNGDFSCPWQLEDEHQFFHNLPVERQNKLLDYRLNIFLCDGTYGEKIEWFRTINIAGLPMNDQEILNAVFAGPWLTAAKRRFSKVSGPAEQVGSKYVKGVAKRQEFLRKAMEWAKADNERLDEYMGRNQNNADDAQALWEHFETVIRWAKSTFDGQSKALTGVDWNALHKVHGHEDLDLPNIQSRCEKLFADPDVTNAAGVYAYVLDGDERHLNIRAFDKRQRQMAYAKQKGRCAISGTKLPIEEMDADHKVPWSKGGKTIDDNCRMVSKHINRGLPT